MADVLENQILQYTLWLLAQLNYQDQTLPGRQRHGQPTCVLDTKYKVFKGSPDPNDRNQMWIYSHRMRVQEGVLIYPAEDPIAYQITFEGIPLRATGLPLVSTLAHFKAACHRFAEQFR